MTMSPQWGPQGASRIDAPITREDDEPVDLMATWGGMGFVYLSVGGPRGCLLMDLMFTPHVFRGGDAWPLKYWLCIAALNDHVLISPS